MTLALGAAFDTHWLNDANADLVNLHTQVAGGANELVAELGTLFVPENNSGERFYALRGEFNEGPAPLRRAALFIYLNRHGYNGLCRYNRSGGFNVPFGKYDAPGMPAEELLAASALLRGATITQKDFREVLHDCGKGDVVYCDPPYVPLSKTASFTAYAAGGFGPHDQRELVDEARAAAKRGARVVLSNHDTPETRELYLGAELESIRVHRAISQRAETRGLVGELIAVYR